MKRMCFLMIIICFVAANSYSNGISTEIKDKLLLNNKYYSNNNNSYAIAVEYSEEIPNSESGVYISTSEYEKYLKIPYLISVGQILWSPDDSYILIDYGTYSYRGFICINIDNLKKIGNIQRQSKEFAFISNNKIIATVEKGFRIEKTVKQYGVNLFILNSESIDIIELFTPSELIDYRFDSYNEGLIKIYKIEYTNTHTESPWERFKKSSEENIIIDLADLDKTRIR